MLLTGRYGYNKNFPGKGGGINTDRLKPKGVSTEDKLRQERELILNLLKHNQRKEAFSYLLYCSSATKEQKQIFCKKYFKTKV